MEENIFTKLSSINVNEKTESKNGLTYLSWAWAWQEFKKIYPNATYTIKRNDLGQPWIYDKDLGYMVFTEVTAGDLTHEMWLPVMDGANKAMKDEEYTYITKSYGKEVQKKVQKASMFDINKTIMRCLTKNLAMFGLGLYIYAGEDLPENLETQEIIDKIKLDALKSAIKKNEIPDNMVELVIMQYGYKKIEDIKMKDYISIVNDFKTKIKE